MCFVSFRQKIFEDIQRFINTKDIINKVVFDLENDRCVSNNWLIACFFKAEKLPFYNFFFFFYFFK